MQDKTGALRLADFVLLFDEVPVSQRLLDIKYLYDDEEGQDLVEYALLLGAIVLACVVAMGALGSAISNLFWTSAAAKLS